MSSNPLVSVIINNYNYGNYVEDAINSALHQTYANIEVIVVDDGSTDNSRDIITNYGSKITSVFKENGGQASACNAGYFQSKGDIIFFLDADDYYYPEMVEKVVKLWHSNIAKVHFRLDKVNTHLKKIGLIPSSKRTLIKGDPTIEFFSCGNVVSPPMSGNAFSRAALGKIMPIPEEKYNYAADAYLLKRMPLLGDYERIDEPMGVYRIHGNNHSNSVSYDNYSEIIRKIKHANDVFPFYQIQAQKKNIYIDKDFQYKNVSLLRFRILLLRIDRSKHFFEEDTLSKLLKLSFRNCLLHGRYKLPRRLYELMLTLWMFVRPVKKAQVSMLTN